MKTDRRHRASSATSRRRASSAAARAFVAGMLLLGMGCAEAHDTSSVAAGPSPSPSPSATAAHSAHAAHAAPGSMLKSKEAQAWAKSAHGTLGAKPMPAAKTTGAVAPAAAQNAAPVITAVAATPTTIHSGDTVRWDVRTSSNVVSVAAHVTLATLQLQRAAPGHFTLAFVIPANTPPLFHGTYNVDVIAKASDGDTATKTILMVFQ